MKEKYVSQATAIKMKEKGFDGECHFVFNTKYESYGLMPCTWPVCNSEICTENQYLVTLPTIAMAMAWVREEHHVIIVPYLCSIGWYFEIQNADDTDITGAKTIYSVGIPSKDMVFKTYEEAAEAGVNFFMEQITKYYDRKMV